MPKTLGVTQVVVEGSGECHLRIYYDRNRASKGRERVRLVHTFSLLREASRWEFKLVRCCLPGYIFILPVPLGHFLSIAHAAFYWPFLHGSSTTEDKEGEHSNWAFMRTFSSGRKISWNSMMPCPGEYFLCKGSLMALRVLCCGMIDDFPAVWIISLPEPRLTALNCPCRSEGWSSQRFRNHDPLYTPLILIYCKLATPDFKVRHNSLNGIIAFQEHCSTTALYTYRCSPS